MARTNSQAQTGVNFDFEVKFDLKGQGQSTPKTIGILTKVFYTYGPNLVILAWTVNELSHGQTLSRTDGPTDGQTQATTIPESQNWPRVKRCDRQTDGQTDGPMDWTTHRAAWSQLKILLIGANKLTHWPYEVILRHKSGSTLPQVMACCQYWFIIHGSFVAFTWEQFHEKCLWA